jgi:ABC-type amino acid transport substrate-binding protein
MKKTLTMIALASVVTVTMPQILGACGDKFLVVSRGTRFQRAAPHRAPAAILLYANPASSLPKTLAELPIEETLRKAGYKSTVIGTSDELDAALRQGGWDLVLVDVADSDAVSRKLQGNHPATVLPIVYKTSSADVARARKQYQCILKSPLKSQSFLDGIDEALTIRSKAGRKS